MPQTPAVKQFDLTCKRKAPGSTIEHITYMFEVDKLALDNMARKAATNKSKQSRDGAVTVTITKVFADVRIQL